MADVKHLTVNGTTIDKTEEIIKELFSEELEEING